MDVGTFTQELEGLSDTDWLRVASGEAVLMVDDRALVVGPAEGPYAVVGAPDGTPVGPAALKRECLKAAGRLLTHYYLNHPLSLAGFNRQLRQLLDTHGAAAFAAAHGRLPRLTLFADDGRLVAESAASPRHRYGAFCELERPLDDQRLVKYVEDWVLHGGAYQRYLAMNLCRCNC